MIELYPHQIDVLEQTADKKRVAYYLDMGLGKTYVGSEKTMSFNNKLNLLICQKSKINDWFEHFKQYDCNIYDLTKPIKKVENDKPNILIINYDLVWRREWIKDLKDFTLMLDESSLISNNSAKRTKFILKLKPNSIVLLSGTPVSGKYERLWSQCKLLGWNITKKDFYERYIIEKQLEVQNIKYPIKLVVGYKNVEELKENLRANGAVFMKTDEVLDMPEQIFNTVNIDITKEYKEFKKERIVSINDTFLVGDTTLTKMLYERQLCSQYNKHKLQSFTDLIESSEDRFIVFYSFTDELNNLLKCVNDRPVSIVNGQTKDLTNYENNENSITFVQYQAGSMGLNLQKANKIIYFSLPLSVEHYMQSLKRIHRIGQKNICLYYLMICKNSIEEKIFKSLKKGEDYTNTLFEKD